MSVITFAIPGAAYTTVLEGAWPNDEPGGALSLRSATITRRGRGFTAHIVTSERIATSLADYLLSVAEVWECMTAEERGGDDPRPLRRAVESIEAALRG